MRYTVLLFCGFDSVLWFWWFWVSGLCMTVGLGWGVLRIDAGGASG